MALAGRRPGCGRRGRPAINDAWLSGDPDAMAEELHPEVVLLPPDDGPRLEGREAAVGSYRSFLGSAVVRSWTERGLTCDIADGTAVVRYRFELSGEMGGEARTDVGHDLWVLAREGGRWRASWRTTTPARDA
ncbi:MAG: nuclear transport factor 2 family protein [Chloroflexota bacterium]